MTTLITTLEKPEITLTPLEKTAVHTPTQKEFDTLMQVYESGAWTWPSECAPTENNHYWSEYGKETCVETEEKFGFDTKEYCEEKGQDIISTQEFYKKQNVSQNQREIINKHFENKLEVLMN